MSCNLVSNYGIQREFLQNGFKSEFVLSVESLFGARCCSMVSMFRRDQKTGKTSGTGNREATCGKTNKRKIGYWHWRFVIVGNFGNVW